MDVPVTELTLATAGAALRRGDFTSISLTEAMLERIAELQPKLNCYISV